MPKVDNAQLYRAAYKKHGRSVQALCWLNERRQRLRFEKILQALPKSIQNLGIVDVGCGFGDLYLYMKEHKRPPKHYIGIEVLDEFVAIARERTDQKILRCDVLCDPLPEADYYVCSGTLNTFTRFETHLALKRMLQHARFGVVCNLLCGDKESEVYNYIPKKELYEMIETLGAQLFYESSGYIEHDITVGLCAQSSE